VCSCALSPPRRAANCATTSMGSTASMGMRSKRHDRQASLHGDFAQRGTRSVNGRYRSRAHGGWRVSAPGSSTSAFTTYGGRPARAESRAEWCSTRSGTSWDTRASVRPTTYLGLNADRLHEALKRFEAHRSGPPANGNARNEVATGVEKGVSETGGHLIEGNSNVEDRSDIPQSSVN
jgi:hypothetical protein